MEKELSVAAYCRVSTDKDEQINSLDSQCQYFREYIRNHPNWKLVDVYYDEGISGTQTKKRAGFNQMMVEAFRGNIDLILTKEVSRFARNTVDTLSYTRKLKDSGIGVIFTIDNIDTREPDGELRLTIMASIAQEESRKTSERVKWGQKRRMEQGIVFGRDLLGYTVKNGILTINEEEAPIVKAIFHKYTNEGKGTYVIARELLEEGMKPKQAAQWSNVAILRALKNEKYVGDLCQKKTITPNYLTHKKKYNNGEEEMIVISNHHPPIIDRELWNRTQEERKKRSITARQKNCQDANQNTNPKTKYSNRYWCSGKLYCGICGRRFVSRTKKYKDGMTYQAWRCYAAARHGRLKQNTNGEDIGCENQSYNEKTLFIVAKYSIWYIWNNVWDDSKELKKEIIREIKNVQNETLEGISKLNVSKIEKKIESYYEKKRKMLDLLLSDAIGIKEVNEQNLWYDSKIDKLEKQLYQYLEMEKFGRHQEKEREEYLLILDEMLNFERQITLADFEDSHYISNYTIHKDSFTSQSGFMDKNKLINQDGYTLEQMYKEVIDKMILYPNGKIHVFLIGLPFAIWVKVQTSGKRELYRTEILEMDVIQG